MSFDGPLPKIHQRVFVVQNAESEISTALNSIIEKHELTSAEIVTAVTAWLLRFTSRLVAQERRSKADEP